MKKLRLGVIGAGSWAIASHLPNLAKRRDDVEFVAVARHGSELLTKVKHDFGFELASEDYREVLAADLDICVVASPSGLHHEHAKAAMEAGAHVLVEKPFTIDPAQAWDLAATAERLERHLVIGFGWHYLPFVSRFKQVLDERGGVGEIEQISIQMASVTRELLADTGAYPDAAPGSVPEQRTWTDPALSGGGYGQAQLSHALGLALWLTGLRGEAAYAIMSAPLHARVELHDAIVLRYAGGAIGTLSGGSCHLGAGGNKHQIEVRAIGSEGQLHIDLERERASLWRVDGETTLPAHDGDGAYDAVGPPNVLVDLALGRPASNNSPAELGARTVEVLDAAYRSAETGSLARIAENDRA